VKIVLVITQTYMFSLILVYLSEYFIIIIIIIIKEFHRNTILNKTSWPLKF